MIKMVKKMNPTEELIERIKEEVKQFGNNDFSDLYVVELETYKEPTSKSGDYKTYRFVQIYYRETDNKIWISRRQYNYAKTERHLETLPKYVLLSILQQINN